MNIVGILFYLVMRKTLILRYNYSLNDILEICFVFNFKVKLKEGPKFIESADDQDFCSAFDKMMSDSFQGRLTEAMKATAVDIAIPMHLKGMNASFVSLIFLNYTNPGQNYLKHLTASVIF